MGNDYRVRSTYYGGYPAGYLRRVRALFPDKRRVLHLFSGQVDLAAFPGDTVDINPALNPSYVDDAQTLLHVPLEQYDLVLADPPYSVEDADHYQTTMVKRNVVMRALQRLPGGRARRVAGPGAADVSQGPVRAGGGDRDVEIHQSPVPRHHHLRPPGCAGVAERRGLDEAAGPALRTPCRRAAAPASPISRGLRMAAPLAICCRCKTINLTIPWAGTAPPSFACAGAGPWLWPGTARSRSAKPSSRATPARCAGSAPETACWPGSPVPRRTPSPCSSGWRPSSSGFPTSSNAPASNSPRTGAPTATSAGWKP